MVYPPQWRRIYHQLSLSLIEPLDFDKLPVISFINVFLVSVIVAIIFCFVKEIKPNNVSPNGISHTDRRILDLPDAASAASSQRLVFVMIGIQSSVPKDLIDAVIKSLGMETFDTQIIDDPISLFECMQTIDLWHKRLLCFRDVYLLQRNQRGLHSNTIIIDENFVENTACTPRQSILSQHLLQIQWALDAHIAQFDSSIRPTEKMWNGYFDEIGSSVMDEPSTIYWLSIVRYFASPHCVFLFLISGHHVSSTVAGERQTPVAELLTAQGVTTTPRVLSNMVSFCILYAPGAIVCSILLGEILFIRTSTDLLFIFMLLACISFIACV